MTSPESAEDLEVGQVLAGKYRVERIIGTGGMGMVVAAHHIQLDERVALKFLLPAAVANMEAVARFMREARAAFKIKSEHVARVIDVAQLEGGAPYIVMEFLDGRDLSAWLAEFGPLPIEQAVDFILQACEALAEAHVLGIVHRDLKPANLFCVQRSDGQLSIKVLDFGISKLTSPDQQQHAMTRTNSLAGSPQYMSPEHMKSSKTVDARTDIWSLGVILHELLAGRAPFEGEAVTELVVKVATEPPIPLRAGRPDAPPQLEAVVARCLQKDRNLRYQTVAEMAVALQEFGSQRARGSVERIVGTLQKAGIAGPVVMQTSSSLPVTDRASLLESNPELKAAQPLRLVAPPPSANSPATVASWGEAKPGGNGGKAMVAIGVGAALSLVAILSFVFWPRSHPPVDQGVFGAGTDTTASASPAPPPQPPPTAAAPLPPSTGSAAPLPPPTSAPASSAQPPHPVAQPAPARNWCNPPYYVDAKGTQHFKKGCF